MSDAIKPILTDADHAAALEEIERLWGAPLGTPDGDRLDVLATLVEAYERKHHAIAPPDPIDAIRFRLDQRGLSTKDLEPLIGPRGRVSEVLSGKRPLTMRMVRKLHTALLIPADVLIRETVPTSRSSRSRSRAFKVA